MDFWAWCTPDVLHRACRNIEERTGTKIVPEEIPTDDEKAFRLMQSGNMDGLFQVEAPYVSLFGACLKQFSDVVTIASNCHRWSPAWWRITSLWRRTRRRALTTTTACAPF